MNAKWWILIAFVLLYLIGVTGVGWHAYDTTDIAKAVPSLEALKIIFIMLGGLGVILPTYLNVWQSLETAHLLQDQERRSKIENTFHLLEKWDDKSLLEARKFTRELKDVHSKLSADEIKSIISEKPELRQSVILLFNYFELIRISVENDRVHLPVIKHTLGDVFNDMYDRFKPWIRDQPQPYQKDLEKFSKMMDGTS